MRKRSVLLAGVPFILAVTASVMAIAGPNPQAIRSKGATARRTEARRQLLSPNRPQANPYRGERRRTDQATVKAARLKAYAANPATARRAADFVQTQPRSVDSRPLDRSQTRVNFSSSVPRVQLDKNFRKRGGPQLQSFGPTDSGYYLRDLLPASDDAGVLTQVQDMWSNNVLLTVNSKGQYKVFMYVDQELGWVAPQDDTVVACDYMTVYKQEFAQPYLTDCWFDKNLSDLRATDKYANGQQKVDRFGNYYYYNGSIFRDYLGHYYYFSADPSVLGTQMKNRFQGSNNGDYFWSDGTKMVYNSFLGGVYTYYPDGKDMFDVLGNINYWNGNIYSHSTNTNKPDLDYADGVNGLFYTSNGVDVMPYHPNVGATTTFAFAGDPVNGSTFWFKNGRLFKDAYGSCYLDDETNGFADFATAFYSFWVDNAATIAGYQDMFGYPSDSTDGERDYIGVYQTEDFADPADTDPSDGTSLITAVSHVMMQNRQNTALVLPLKDPENLTLAEVGTHTAKVTWTHPADSGNWSYVVAVAYAPDIPECTADWGAVNVGYTTESPIEGLDPGRTFNVTVCASDSSTEALGNVTAGVYVSGTTQYLVKVTINYNKTAGAKISFDTHAPNATWYIDWTTDFKTWTIGQTFPGADGATHKEWTDTAGIQTKRFYRARSQ